MAKRTWVKGSAGFSLVEMMVALLFTLVLMAGMSSVFKGTLMTFTTSSEKLASARRNRMSLDLLYDDLNNAGMYLTDLTTSPALSDTNPAFYFNPGTQAKTVAEVLVANEQSGVNQGADELLFYMDEPLPFEGTLGTTGAKVAAQMVNEAVAPTTTDFTYTIACTDPTYAKQVTKGLAVIFKDSWETQYIKTATPSGSDVTIETEADPQAAITGRGASGLPSKFPHITASGLNPGTGIVFVRPAQMVRYSIRVMNLDPANTSALTPCLVRQQGAYNNTAFTPNPGGGLQIITENVTGFRVYLSADAGKNWVGGDGFNTWANIRTGLNAQLASSGREGFKSIDNDFNWIRSIPVLVRVDVTTRTTTRRAEYSSQSDKPAFKQQTQSVVMVPRHFGLTMN